MIVIVAADLSALFMLFLAPYCRDVDSIGCFAFARVSS